jgi:hypothetical protein
MLLKVSLNTITLILPPSATFITNLNPGSTTSAAIRLNLLQQSTWISINCLCTLKKNLVGYFGSLTFNNWSSNSLLSSELFYFNLFSDNTVLLMEEIGKPQISHWQTLSHNIVSSTPRNERQAGGGLMASTCCFLTMSQPLFYICKFTRGKIWIKFGIWRTSDICRFRVIPLAQNLITQVVVNPTIIRSLPRQPLSQVLKLVLNIPVKNIELVGSAC